MSAREASSVGLGSSRDRVDLTAANAGGRGIAPRKRAPRCRNPHLGLKGVASRAECAVATWGSLARVLLRNAACTVRGRVRPTYSQGYSGLWISI